MGRKNPKAQHLVLTEMRYTVYGSICLISTVFTAARRREYGEIP